MDPEERAPTPGSAREVLVVAYHAGTIALRGRSDGCLEIPSRPGAGEADARRLFQSSLNATPSGAQLLGTSAGTGTRPLFEIWLVRAETSSRSSQEPAQEATASGVVWLPLEGVLRGAGSPRVRGIQTLVALHALARSEAVPTLQLPEGSAESASRLLTLQGEIAPAAEPASDPQRPTTLATAPEAVVLHPGAVLNMDLSELAFNERVLALAADPEVPLLERLRFVSIVGSNLDEFFRTRVAGFKRQMATHSTKRTLDGLTPEEQLQAIAIRTRLLLGNVYRVLLAEILPQLEANGIRILPWSELGERQREFLERRYITALQNVLVPQRAGGGHPFPHVRNLRPALAVATRSSGTSGLQLTIVQLPNRPPQFIRLPRSRCFVALAEVIRALLPRLLPGEEIVSAHAFRITRSARLEVEEEETGDLLEAVERAIARRPIQPPVRLEVERGMPDEIGDLLLRELAAAAHEEDIPLSPEDVYHLAPPVDLYSLHEIARLSIPGLRYPPLERRRRFAKADSLFEVIRAGEQLVQFPRDSFEDTVERFLAEAAADPAVTCIKITLYRTSQRARIIRLLHEARDRGKKITAVVELLASFDEEQNIRWARSLASHGIRVLYGSPRQKVHAKLALVDRREADAHRHYVYIGTGNLNGATAAGYTDLGLFSAEPALTAEVDAVFHRLAGTDGGQEYRQLLVAPLNLRERFFELIDREIRNVQAGRGGHIRAKLNGLADNDMIAALYRASRAGVRIELLVRGICALRPGVPGLSDNIRVISLLGRFLEHSRIFRFENAGSPEYFIGSADWRGRNLSRRVEVVTPVRRPEHQAELEGILASGLADPNAWELQANGSYVQRSAAAEPLSALTPGSLVPRSPSPLPHAGERDRG